GGGMNSTLIFITLLLVTGIAVFGLSTDTKEDTQQKVLVDASSNGKLDRLGTVKKTMGVVSVAVTPEVVESEKELVFEVVMNNHAVDLNYAYTQISELRDDSGNIYKPKVWTGN